MFGAKIKIEKALLDRVKAVSDKAGYSSVDEFITNVLEKELAKLEGRRKRRTTRGTPARPGVYRIVLFSCLRLAQTHECP